MTILHMILNVSAINSRVIYQFSPHGKQMRRTEYIKQLGISLCESHIRHQISNPKVNRKLRDATSYIFKIDPERPVEQPAEVPKSKRKRCSLCPSKKRPKNEP